VVFGTESRTLLIEFSVLQCVAACCSVENTVCCSVESRFSGSFDLNQCVAVCCSVLQCVAVFRLESRAVLIEINVLQYVAVCCSALPSFRLESRALLISTKDSSDRALMVVPALHVHTHALRRHHTQIFLPQKL